MMTFVYFCGTSHHSFPSFCFPSSAEAAAAAGRHHDDAGSEQAGQRAAEGHECLGGEPAHDFRWVGFVMFVGLPGHATAADAQGYACMAKQTLLQAELVLRLVVSNPQAWCA